jgi:hypothetical protein
MLWQLTSTDFRSHRPNVFQFNFLHFRSRSDFGSRLPTKANNFVSIFKLSTSEVMLIRFLIGLMLFGFLKGDF